MRSGTRNALLVVDVQNDFCPGGALAVALGNLIIPPLNNMIRHGLKNDWRIFSSRDWHPEDTAHFAKFGGKWPVHCVKQTNGARFHPDLMLHGSMYIITKGTSKDDDGYSPFEGVAYDYPLNHYLAEFRIKNLYVGGLATDYCVKAACLDARKLGYTVYLLTDACRAVNLKPTDESDALEEMRRAGVIFTTTDEVLR